MQGVIVIKVIDKDSLEDIQNDLERYEKLLDSEEIVLNDNNEYVVDVYDVIFEDNEEGEVNV
jgi:hypothetical protein